ncbi:MAG: hypothetical protein IKZ87_01285 [Actinomycetaceae bacterium]|nr:hypothetical protein [Actinomycetaceae bacterium]
MATTKTHNREMSETITVDGSDFYILMDKHEVKNYDGCERLLERKISLQWVLKGFCVKMRVAREAGSSNETVEYILPRHDAVAPEELANILSSDEKRTMLRAIDELNEWQKMNPHLPEIGDYVWRIAIDAKLSEVEQ